MKHFTWPVSCSGYVWDQIFLSDTTLVGLATFATGEGVRTYRPMTDEPDLFVKFAELGDAAGNQLAFAARYGHLTRDVSVFTERECGTGWEDDRRAAVRSDGGSDGSRYLVPSGPLDGSHFRERLAFPNGMDQSTWFHTQVAANPRGGAALGVGHAHRGDEAGVRRLASDETIHTRHGRERMGAARLTAEGGVDLERAPRVRVRPGDRLPVPCAHRPALGPLAAVRLRPQRGQGVRQLQAVREPLRPVGLDHGIRAGPADPGPTRSTAARSVDRTLPTKSNGGGRKVRSAVGRSSRRRLTAPAVKKKGQARPRPRSEEPGEDERGHPTRPASPAVGL